MAWESTPPATARAKSDRGKRRSSKNSKELDEGPGRRKVREMTKTKKPDRPVKGGKRERVRIIQAEMEVSFTLEGKEARLFEMLRQEAQRAIAGPLSAANFAQAMWRNQAMELAPKLAGQIDQSLLAAHQRVQTFRIERMN